MGISFTKGEPYFLFLGSWWEVKSFPMSAGAQSPAVQLILEPEAYFG